MPPASPEPATEATATASAESPADGPATVLTADSGLVFGTPQPVLRQYVDRYIGYWERAREPLIRREVAGAFVVVVLGWGAPMDVTDPLDADRGVRRTASFAAGVYDRYVTTHLPAGLGQGVELMLSPLVAGRLLGLPGGELGNRSVNVDQLPGGWLGRLRDRLAEAPDWPARFALLDRAIGARLAATADPDPRLDRAWQRLADTHGRVSIGQLAAEVGWSRRHLATVFQREIGLAPKTAARVLRFQRAYADGGVGSGAGGGSGDGGGGSNGGGGAHGGGGLADGGWADGGWADGGWADGGWADGGWADGGWAAVAARCGYYDQAHLIRDFREFAGATPTEFAGFAPKPVAGPCEPV
ncbi:AraC family transcriptional regulator [Solwaraspora sp. WMMD1047]|uniref:helix-turn-helix domain-containing protein n=1 Tax=Solwaraspora sp. WMMD1047 TaxID=3016102 RepID=UPI002416EBA8|nr:AraC family transcriptional regulator [Solwaraspora sp. WMMD1047]MDG4831964.1 AraC family transcriptional regulator [Solwaraspora sp. WMMD1047]